VSLLRNGDHWTLRIADDGVGIDTSKPHNTTRTGSFRCGNARGALGGESTVRGQPGRGTVVEITVPVEKEKVA
jgi:signal transduction histidine kinase